MNSTNSRRYYIVTFLLAFAIAACSTTTSQQEITFVGPITTHMWPIFIAKEAGYYERHGLRVRLVFANHPADIAMLVSGEAHTDFNTLQQAMLLSPKYSSIMLFGSPLRKWSFALVARRDIRSVHGLKRKRIGVTQIGGSTYNYATRLLAQFGLNLNEVEWVGIGANSRAGALVSGRVDATMLSAPAFFDLEAAGYNVLADIKDFDDIDASNVLVITRDTISKNPALPEAIIRANAEAVRRFYDDKDFSISAYSAYDPQSAADLERVYEMYTRANAFERVPYILGKSVRYVIDNAPDAVSALEMKRFDYHSVIDNKTVDRLVHEQFFETLFGPEVLAEQKARAALAFR
jgi:ABC-type nitrate/sulfonate/bicarbonate transport system substrate-binding protein